VAHEYQHTNVLAICQYIKVAMEIMLRFYSNVSAIRHRHLQTLQMGGEVEYHEEQPRPGDGLSCWSVLGDDAFARSNWPQLHSWT